jgi:hypothetical protein
MSIFKIRRKRSGRSSMDKKDKISLTKNGKINKRA